MPLTIWEFLFNVGIHSTQTDKRAFPTVTKSCIHLKYNKSRISLFSPAGCNRLYPKPHRGKNLLLPAKMWNYFHSVILLKLIFIPQVLMSRKRA